MTAEQWFDDRRAEWEGAWQRALARWDINAARHWKLVCQALTEMHDEWEQTH